MTTKRKLYLPSAVTIFSKLYFMISVPGPDKRSVFFRMAALRRAFVATVAYPRVIVAIQKGGVWVINLALRRLCDFVHYLCP